MAARDSKGRFLPSDGGGASTAADDVAGLGESLGIAGTAADTLNDQLGSLGGNSAGDSLSAKFEGLGSVSKGLSSIFESAGKGLDHLGEKGILSAEQIGAANDGLAKATEMLGPYAEAADVVVAAIGAIVSKLWELGKAAVAATQEKDALRATFDVFTGGAGDDLLAGLEELSSGLPFTADKLNALAKSMLSAVGSGEELKTALRAVAAATAIMGESGGAAAEGLIKRFAMMAESGQKVSLDRRILTQLASAGISVQALAKALGVAPDQLGKMKIAAGDLSAAMQTALIQNGSKALAVMGDTWKSISAKLSEGWDDAFEDLGALVGPFMAQLRSLASEFFAGSTAGGEFKDVIKGVLTPAFEVATRSIRAMHIAYLNVLIAFLRAKIFLAPLIDALSSIGVSGGIVNVVMYLIAGTAIALAFVFGVLALAVFLVALPFIIAAVAIYGLVKAIQYIYGLISGAAGNFGNLSTAAAEGGASFVQSVIGMVTGAGAALLSLPLAAAEAAANFVGGLVSGIASGAGAVADAVKSLAAGALASFTSFFGIASPSKVMREHGKTNIAEEGLAEGIDQGAGEVDRAMADMTDGPKGKGGKGKGSPTRIVRIEEINFYGSAADFPSFREQADAWLEELDAEGPEAWPS